MESCVRKMLNQTDKNLKNIFDTYVFSYFWGYFYFSAGAFAWLKFQREKFFLRNSEAELLL